MMALRSASLSEPHAAISASVRPQPMHSPVCPLTAQTFMQGVEIGAELISFDVAADFPGHNLVRGRLYRFSIISH